MTVSLPNRYLPLKELGKVWKEAAMFWLQVDQNVKQI